MAVIDRRALVRADTVRIMAYGAGRPLFNNVLPMLAEAVIV